MYLEEKRDHKQEILGFTMLHFLAKVLPYS